MIKGFKSIAFFGICVFLLIQSCDTTNYQFTPKHYTVIKDSLGKQLVHQCSRPSPRGATQFFDLTENDVLTLHTNFKKVYELEPAEDFFIDYAITNLEAYAYQYVGFIYKGTRYVYINAFTIENATITRHDWKNIPMVVCDGGPQLWGVVFDMDKKRFYNLYLNGPM
ncbi:hypothetical protein [uncultured Kordia sp.]|uniref:hypothetical protein n=1 Tax=uncultured Kordia sp. TaxID=507699 RepID=UPI0026020BC8|nr:hypothetical protein [uncultured Kordia sp.]